jgi:NAD(P)-dependent dehydrogenase (short-subunit alcohol dehydrogenase family)
VTITLDAPRLFDLSGRVAIVTGAGSGIGQCIALGFAQMGADVACLDRRTDAGVQATLDMIAETGCRGIGIAADVTDPDAMGRAVAETEARLGPLTIALNAAGIANANPAEEMGVDQYQTLMDINLKGVFLSARLDVGGDREPRADAGAL